MILTGEMISAEEALRIGLVNRGMPAAEMIARKIVVNAPLAVNLRGWRKCPVIKRLSLEATLLALLRHRGHARRDARLP